MFLKNSSTLLFSLKNNLFNFLIFLFITSCSLKPLNFSENNISIFFEFKKNPLNYSLVQELKRNFFLINAVLANSKEAADYVISISDHRLGKFLEATDENFFPAVVSLDYQLRLAILNLNTKKMKEIPIFTSEDFSYDTESILSNEKQVDEIKLDFFTKAVNELIIFFSEENNVEQT